jgi:hypothetical protein
MVQLDAITLLHESRAYVQEYGYIIFVVPTRDPYSHLAGRDLGTLVGDDTTGRVPAYILECGALVVG